MRAGELVGTLLEADDLDWEPETDDPDDSVSLTKETPVLAFNPDTLSKEEIDAIFVETSNLKLSDMAARWLLNVKLNSEEASEFVAAMEDYLRIRVQILQDMPQEWQLGYVMALARRYNILAKYVRWKNES